MKKFIKYVVMSHVYQQSSTADHSAMEVDPDNTLLWRMAPRRLDAECLRDAMLAVSEQLDTTPPVGSVVARAGEGPVTTFGPNRVLAAINDPRNTHRSIYLPVIRDNLPEALALFDAADPSLISVNRPQTTAPWAQGDGRDNNNKGYSMWMAGGGTKGGLSYGATDEYGYEAVEGRVHVHDWHATILHLLGLDHERLTFRYAGRNMRLTDVKGHVVREIIE